MKSHLLERVVKNLPTPKTGNKIHYDELVKGFGVRITANGSRAFILNYRSKGRERRYTIGNWPDWSVTAARQRASNLKKEIDLGRDPMGERHEERQAATVNELYKRYDAEHLPKKAARAALDNRAMWRDYILPTIGRIKVQDVTRRDVDKLHRNISSTKPTRANRVLEVVRSAFNLAIKWKWITENPAVGIDKNTELPRTRYLSGKELAFLSVAMKNHHQENSTNAIRLMLFTGCRKGEALSATWDQFDIDAGIWIKPSAHTKQRREHRIPLSSSTIELLKLVKNTSSSKYVFPSKKEGHLQDCKQTWKSLREAVTIAIWKSHREIELLIAELETSLGRKPKISEIRGVAIHKEIELPTGLMDVRIHDLRHTYASILASEGLSLPVIGALLGHTQPQTTARYAHLFDDPLRAATEQVATFIQGHNKSKNI